MSDFASPWRLSRARFEEEISGLNATQLNWRIHPSSLSIGEMAIHIAGVEISFASQLTEMPLNEKLQRIKTAATEGVVNEHSFPFGPSEITPGLVSQCLAAAREILEPVIVPATPEVRAKTIKSALGPMIDGDGAFARLGFHAAYHQGQAYLIKNSDGFPQAD